MKKIIFSFGLALLSIFFFSCQKEEAPVAAFSAIEGSSSNQSISIDFTDNSSNSPSEWLWTFEGGTPSTSTEKNPIITYTSPGTFDVTLEVTNEGGSNQTISYDFINIGEFNNPTLTEMDITINNKTKTVPVDDYALFANIDNSLMEFYAETYGTTSTGSMIGLDIYWEGTANLNEYSSWNLNVNEDFVFFYVTNSGSDNLNPFYVNWGTNDETEDNIIIENNGNTTSTGYYYANSGMEVRGYLQSSSTAYVYWIEGVHFDLPWTTNQYKNLGNTNKSTKEIEKEKQEVRNPNAGNIYQTGAK